MRSLAKSKRRDPVPAAARSVGPPACGPAVFWLLQRPGARSPPLQCPRGELHPLCPCHTTISLLGSWSVARVPVKTQGRASVQHASWHMGRALASLPHTRSWPRSAHSGLIPFQGVQVCWRTRLALRGMAVSTQLCGPEEVCLQMKPEQWHC